MGIATGKIDREIASLRDCSRRTVQKHMQRLYVTFGVTTRIAAVMRSLGAWRRSIGGIFADRP